MNRIGVSVAVLALVLAGCSGFGGQGAPERLTPAPIPTDDAQYPPGVSERAIEPGVLARSHEGSLRTSSYTLTTRQRIEGDDGEVLRRTNRSRLVAKNASSYRGYFLQNTTEYPSAGLTTRVDYWTNGSVVATRYEERTGRRSLHMWPADSVDSVTDLTGRQRLEAVLEAVDVRIARHEPDGDVVLVGSDFVDRDRLIRPLFVSHPTNVSVQLRVRSDGTVVAKRIGYDATLSGRDIRIVRTTRLSNEGETTVDRPAWVANATMETEE
ncbi:hypothetical protein ACFQL1_04975 [Halomicroarcula sp. GCM10025709]|uniref:hypothetical protein n=1 Tax=Haloarcula TaxID=2237 RepID=UPI0024C32946|nr:hypothetical protein [Halomicroarcula sp. YJ-61-S]